MSETLMTPADFVPYADRDRVGLLMIPDEIVAPEEIRRLLDNGPSFYQHRVDYEETDTPTNRTKALRAMHEAIAAIRRVRPHVVVFACTSGGAFAGGDFHEELLGQMREDLPGAPVFTAVEAVACSLQELGVTRIAMGTPYSDDVIGGVVEILMQRGIDLVRNEKLFPDGYPDPWTVMSTHPSRVAEFALSLDCEDAECVFVSCAGLPSASVVADVEARIGKPLLTSNIAIARAIQRSLRLGPVRGYGSILAAPSTK